MLMTGLDAVSTITFSLTRVLSDFGDLYTDRRPEVMGDMSSEEPGPNDPSPLIDLGQVSLDDVARLGDSVLAHSIYRILGDAKNPDAVVLASFSAAV